MHEKTLHKVNATLFGIVALLHLYRSVSGKDLTLGSWVIPLWASIVAVIVLGYLCYANARA